MYNATLSSLCPASANANPPQFPSYYNGATFYIHLIYYNYHMFLNHSLLSTLLF